VHFRADGPAERLRDEPAHDDLVRLLEEAPLLEESAVLVHDPLVGVAPEEEDGGERGALLARALGPECREVDARDRVHARDRADRGDVVKRDLAENEIRRLPAEDDERGATRLHVAVEAPLEPDGHGDQRDDARDRDANAEHRKPGADLPL
jgi:hypothetical protein